MPLAAPPDESPARVRELAHEFEAMFLAQMLKQMRQSMTQSGENDEGDGFGKAAFTDTFDTELARHLSSAGGLGIARIIIEAFERREGTSTGPTGSSGSPGWVDPPGSPVPAVAGAPASPPPASTSPELPGPVSSAFGWRRDPLKG
jgi:peptidoglycan hydrolase FlgJ